MSGVIKTRSSAAAGLRVVGCFSETPPLSDPSSFCLAVKYDIVRVFSPLSTSFVPFAY